jgi:hypothetical protein
LALAFGGLVELVKSLAYDHIHIQVAFVVLQGLQLRRQVGDDPISRMRCVGRLLAVRARLDPLAFLSPPGGDVADLAARNGGWRSSLAIL